MTELSPAQREHWERRLEDAEKAVEVAKRMLGIIAVESVERENEREDQPRNSDI